MCVARKKANARWGSRKNGGFVEMDQIYYTHYEYTIHYCPICGKSDQVEIREQNRPVSDEPDFNPYATAISMAKDCEKAIRQFGICECVKPHA
jgi:hypothetical protein